MTFKLLQSAIKSGNYSRESTLKKMDIFLISKRITEEEYQNLFEMMVPQ